MTLFNKTIYSRKSQDFHIRKEIIKLFPWWIMVSIIKVTSILINNKPLIWLKDRTNILYFQAIIISRKPLATKIHTLVLYPIWTPFLQWYHKRREITWILLVLHTRDRNNLPRILFTRIILKIDSLRSASKEAQTAEIHQLTLRASRNEKSLHRFLSAIIPVMKQDHYLHLAQPLKLRIIRKELKKLMPRRWQSPKLSQITVIKMKIQWTLNK